MSEEKHIQVSVDSLVNDHPFLWGYSIMDHGIWKTEIPSPTDKLVYLAITSKANSTSAVAFPSYNTLAKMTGLSKPTVIKSVKTLIELDLITKKETAYKSNQYMVKSVQNSKKLGIDRNEIIGQLEKKLHMSVEQAIAPKDPEPLEQPKKADSIPYKEIIGYLNEKTGKRFAHTTEKNCREFIRARWSDLKRTGMNDEDVSGEFIRAIDTKVAHWLNTTSDKNLRPSTLFRSSNFDRYRNEDPNVKPFMGKESGQASDNRFEDFLNSDD